MTDPPSPPWQPMMEPAAATAHMAHGLEPSAEEGVPPPNKTLVRSESADHKRSRMLSYIKEQRDASAAEGDAPNIMLISGELVKASQDVQGSEDDNSSASGSQSGSDSGSSWGGSSMDSGMTGSNDSQGSRRSTGARQKRAALQVDMLRRDLGCGDMRRLVSGHRNVSRNVRHELLRWKIVDSFSFHKKLSDHIFVYRA